MVVALRQSLPGPKSKEWLCRPGTSIEPEHSTSGRSLTNAANHELVISITDCTLPLPKRIMEFTDGSRTGRFHDARKRSKSKEHQEA